MKRTPLLLLRGLTLALTLAILWPDQAGANGHWRRRLGGVRATETVLVQPTTYIVPASAAYCCGDGGTAVAVEPGYRPTGYYVTTRGYGYALPTRYVVTSMSSFDLPAASGSAAICCDPDPCANFSSASYSSSPRSSADNSAPASETSAAQAQKTVTSQPRRAAAPARAPSPRDNGDESATRSTPPPPADNEPDREAVPAPADADADAAGANPNSDSNAGAAATRRNRDADPSPEADGKSDRGLNEILPPLPPSGDTKKASGVNDNANTNTNTNTNANEGADAANSSNAGGDAPKSETAATPKPAVGSNAPSSPNPKSAAPVDADAQRASAETPAASGAAIRSTPKSAGAGAGAGTGAGAPKREIVSQPAGSEVGTAPPSTDNIVEQAADELLRSQSRKPVAGPVIAETVVQGTVIESANRDPQPNVKVIFTDLDRKQPNLVAITDALGRYAVRVPTGRWRLTVSALDSKPAFYADLDVEDGVVRNIANGRRYSTITLKR